MTFLYPVSRQYPFDAACERVVRRLEALDWQAPGIEITFHRYMGAPYSQVLTIGGQDFLMQFSRNQGELPDSRVNIAAVSGIAVEKEALFVAAEPESTTLYLYAGKKWPEERRQFQYNHGLFDGSRARTCRFFHYTGHWPDDSSRPDGLPPVLAPVADDMSIYQLKGTEFPERYEIDELFSRFTAWLDNTLLVRLEAGS